MNPRSVVLDLRKQSLVEKIAAQRSRLEWQLDAIRRPLQVIDVALGLGATLRRNAKFAGVIAIGAGFMLMRGGLFPKVLRTLRLANAAARWWILGRLGWQLVRREPAVPT